MRVLIVLTLSFAIGYGIAHFDEGEAPLDPTALLGSEPDPDEGNAIEIRCGELAGWQRSECESSLVARFNAGATDPESVLRLHCTRVDSDWDTRPRPAPPAVCTQRFGGWLTS
jgi:hypothetical protein